MTQHGGGDGAQNFNLVDPPWKNSQGETIDPAFEAAYTDNLTHIMAPHREGEVVKSYNYPTENLHGGVDEIMSHIEDIYENQNNSFKLNINLGFILRNQKNGAYRYHIPYGNSYLFRTPFTITRHGSLRALKNKIKRLNPAAYVENQRPNSVWELAYITNIHFDITLLDYVLGQTTTTNLPKHVKDSNSILTFTEQDDNLCFFRCMAWHQCKSQTGLEALTHRKFQTWGDYRSINTNKKFPGVKLCDIPDLENCFQVNINVFQLLEHQKVTVHYKSQSSFSDTLYLDMQGNHLSYVKDIDNYAKRYQCPRCDRLFKRYYYLKRHYSVCSKVTKYKFPGGFHKTSQTVFQELEKYGICVPQKERVFPYFITYDFEAVLQKLNNDTAKKLIWEEKHVPISVGVGSNVEEYKEGVCFVSYDLDELLSQMIERMHTIAKAVKTKQVQKFAWVFEKLQAIRNSFQAPNQTPVSSTTGTASSSDTISRTSNAGVAVENHAAESDEYEPPSKKFARRVNVPNTFDSMIARLRDTDELRAEFHEFSSDDSDTDQESILGDDDVEERCHEEETGRTVDPRERFRQTMLKKIEQLQGRFDNYCSCVPVLGFNSSKYDLNLVKSKLCRHLELTDQDKRSFTVKRNNSYLTIATPLLKFLDVSHYIAPGYSYSQFLKSYKAKEQKSFFCYQYLRDPSVLKETKLPPYEAFFSDLKECNVLEQDWKNWQQKSKVMMKTQDLENHRYQNKVKCVDSNIVSCKDDCVKPTCVICKKMCCVCSEIPETGPGNYWHLLKVWKEHDMKTVKDFLVYYNLKDIDPFTEAVTNLQQFYFDNNIDLFKDTISVPGATRKMMFQSKDSNFALFDQTNEDLYRKIKQNICGGPSIVFTRSMSVGQKLKDSQETCAKIFGFDANALYPYCLRQDMPCGSFARRREEQGYKPVIQNKYLNMYIWMDHLSEMKNINILHKLNSGKEHFIMGFYVDGIHNNDVYEYHGCFFHGCISCTEKMKHKKSEKWVKDQEAKYRRTKLRTEYLESLGYKVHKIWECEFQKSSSFSNEAIRNRYSPQFYQQHKHPLSKETLLSAIQTGSLFGMAEVDIEVPDAWQGDFRPELSPYDYFKEFSPLFCTTEVPPEAMGEHMMQHCIDHNAPTTSRRLLVGGMKARQILLATPLLQWYLNHGLVVTRLYEIVEFSPVKCFKNFVDQGIEGRRQSDNDPNLGLLGDTFKILLNSSYGSSILNKENFSDTQYIQGHSKVKIEVNKPEFRKATLLGDDVYELDKGKNKITMDVPIQIGFTILNYAKLRMLEFYYNCLCKYIPRNKFECVQMDSLYFGLAHQNLQEAVYPHLKSDFLKQIRGTCGHPREADAQTFFPQSCCKEDALYTMRSPGLFKEEATGYSMTALCSKTYVIENHGGYKLSCKGINKKSVSDPAKIMSTVLQNQISQSGINKGFRAKDNTMYTYTQKRVGFNYFYCKRQVQDDGIHTAPLNLVLSPWPVYDRHIFRENPMDPLCNSHHYTFDVDHLQFISLDHFLVFSLVRFHLGEECASVVQTETAWSDICKHKNDVSIKMSWYDELAKVLEAALQFKYTQCEEFRNALDSLHVDEIVFADKDSHLGCGMNYSVAVLTPSKKYPGQNVLGTLLATVKKDNKTN